MRAQQLAWQEKQQETEEAQQQPKVSGGLAGTPIIEDYFSVHNASNYCLSQLMTPSSNVETKRNAVEELARSLQQEQSILAKGDLANISASILKAGKDVDETVKKGGQLLQSAFEGYIERHAAKYPVFKVGDDTYNRRCDEQRELLREFVQYHPDPLTYKSQIMKKKEELEAAREKLNAPWDETFAKINESAHLLKVRIDPDQALAPLQKQIDALDKQITTYKFINDAIIPPKKRLR